MKIKTIIIGVILIGVLAFLFYAYSPLLYDREVNEGFPIIDKNDEMNVKNQSIIVEENDSKIGKNKTEINREINESEMMENNSKKDEILFELQGVFVNGESSYKTSGVATVYDIEDERILRFENFSSTNGPDLKVYLATDSDISKFVSLGDLKGNIGNQNYEIPNDVDLEEFDTVVIWCERFSALFGYAQLE